MSLLWTQFFILDLYVNTREGSISGLGRRRQTSGVGEKELLKLSFLQLRGARGEILAGKRTTKPSMR